LDLTIPLSGYCRYCFEDGGGQQYRCSGTETQAVNECGNGVPSILLGYLIFLSGYLPKLLGALLALGGLGFVISNFALALALAYASSSLLLPTVIAAPSLTVWLLVRGVDVAKWEEKAATRDANV
jgi:Domain of unknown function (DUF4386)